MDSTPQIEAIISELTEMCRTAIGNSHSLDGERLNELTRALAINGWQRHRKGEAPISVVIRDRVLDRCQEPAMHRGAELDAVTEMVQLSLETATLSSSTPESESHS